MEPEAEFRASRVRALWLILASLGFVAVGIWAGRSGAWAGWVAVAFFGVCLLVAIVQVITAGRTFVERYRVVLGREPDLDQSDRREVLRVLPERR